jgi:hypothetical protein
MASGTSRYQRAARENCEPTARTRISPGLVSVQRAGPYLTIKDGSFFRRPARGAPPGGWAGVPGSGTCAQLARRSGRLRVTIPWPPWSRRMG